MPPSSRAWFLPAPDGQRLCVHHAPAGPVRGAVVYVHPWAEEMNKSRRMAALQSRALASAGFAVLQLDLQGCGDSSGEWTASSWACWLDDVVRAVGWLREQHPAAAVWLWGLRAGCLVAVQAASRLDQPAHLLLWQPTPVGKSVLQQFLRLKVAAGLQGGSVQEAADATGSADTQGTMATMRKSLLEGQPVSVAGYELPAALATDLERAQLDLPAKTGQVVWIEVSTRADAALLPASAQRVQAWRAQGHAVLARVVPGPPFWQTQEIEDAPALLDATLAALVSATPA